MQYSDTNSLNSFLAWWGELIWPPFPPQQEVGALPEGAVVEPARSETPPPLADAITVASLNPAVTDGMPGPGRKLPWALAGASLVGRQHIDGNVPCQDTSGWRRIAGGEAVAAVVADGAGSVRFARQGSRCAAAAVMRVLATLVRAPEDEAAVRAMLLAAVWAAREDLEGLAKARGAALGDFATTLSVCLFTPERVGIAQIGDSVVVLRDRANLSLPLSPDKFEYLNQTCFVTCDDFSTRLKIHVTEGPVGDVALLTDGLADITLRRQGSSYLPQAAFYDPVFKWNRERNSKGPLRRRQLNDFLLTHASPRTGDDISLVLVSNHDYI